MKQTLIQAFSKQLVDLDQQFKFAVEEACRPERVQAILNEAANNCIQEVLTEETKSYFLYGDGRKLVMEKVKQKLSELL